jgi:hypothetical protein
MLPSIFLIKVHSAHFTVSLQSLLFRISMARNYTFRTADVVPSAGIQVDCSCAWAGITVHEKPARIAALLTFRCSNDESTKPIMHHAKAQ